MSIRQHDVTIERRFRHVPRTTVPVRPDGEEVAA